MNDSSLPLPKRPKTEDLESDSSLPSPKRPKTAELESDSSPPPQIPKTSELESGLQRWISNRKNANVSCPSELSSIVLMYSRFYTMHHKADEHIRDVLDRRCKKGHDDEFVEMMKWILWVNQVD